MYFTCLSQFILSKLLGTKDSHFDFPTISSPLTRTPLFNFPSSTPRSNIFVYLNVGCRIKIEGEERESFRGFVVFGFLVGDNFEFVKKRLGILFLFCWKSKSVEHVRILVLCGFSTQSVSLVFSLSLSFSLTFSLFLSHSHSFSLSDFLSRSFVWVAQPLSLSPSPSKRKKKILFSCTTKWDGTLFVAHMGPLLFCA